MAHDFDRDLTGLGSHSPIGALGIYLFVSHTDYILAALPYVLLMACPLMHLFMHKGHGDGHGGRK